MVSDFLFLNLFAPSPSWISDISVALCVNLDSPHRFEDFFHHHCCKDFVILFSNFIFHNYFLWEREKIWGKIQDHSHDVTHREMAKYWNNHYNSLHQEIKSISKVGVIRACKSTRWIIFSYISSGRIKISLYKINYQEKEISECVEMMNCSAWNTLC